MAVFRASDVVNGSIAFDPAADVLYFETGKAAQLVFQPAENDLWLGLDVASIRLVGVAYASLAASSLAFADNSLFRPGSALDDFLFGFDGDDFIDGGAGDDRLDGGLGNDHLLAGAGGDRLLGGAGDDTLVGGDGVDTLQGDGGNDSYIVTNETTFVDDSGGLDNAIVSASFVKLPSTIEQISFVQGAQALPYWIDALLPDAASGLRYRSFLDGEKTFRFAFPAALPDYDHSLADANQFTGFNEAQKAFVRQTFGYIATVLDLDFTETSTTAARNTITLGNNFQPDSTAYAYLPSDSYLGSDVFLDLDVMGNLAPADGSYAALTLIHELGHALGLEHPFPGGSDAPYLVGAEDDTAWTVMSYNGQAAQYHAAYRPLDLAALQYLYGPSPQTRSGDDTYLVDAGAPNFVWDGGGTDTLSAAAQSQAVTLSLAPGHWGWVGAKAATITAAGQVTVNFGTLLENLVGGAGSDTLTGNAAANGIEGGAGFDYLEGGAGNDTLRGGPNGDTLLGGDGDDYLSSGRGLDQLRGGAGNDTLLGLLGSDTLAGESGFDFLDGGDGDDQIDGGLQGDTVYGGAGNDLLGGARGLDSLDGGDGNDTLAGGPGRDTLTGGAGADHYQYMHAVDGVIDIDLVTDFQTGVDVIELSASIFAVFAGQVGNVVTTDTHLLYDNTSGVLAYDSDGAGAMGPVAFAILGAGSHPGALGHDFLIIG